MNKTPKAVRQFLTTIGRKGGRARRITMTAEQRRESARRAARARWSQSKNRGGNK